MNIEVAPNKGGARSGAEQRTVPPHPVHTKIRGEFRRSTTNTVLGGVCGGLGEYFDVDTTLIRALVILALFVSGGSVAIAYILVWILVSEESPADS